MKSPLHETGTANSMMNIPIFESKELAAWQSGYAAGLAAGEAARWELVETLVIAAIPLEAIQASVTWELSDAIKSDIFQVIKKIRTILQKHEKGSGG